MKKEIVKGYYEGEASDYDRQFYLEDSSYPTLRYRHNYMLGMVEELSMPSDACVLDVGCGPGEMVMDLVRDRWTIYGIDIAREMIDLAEQRLARADTGNAKVLLEVGDIENLRFPDQHFDLIVISGVIEYLDDDVLWLHEIKRTLKPGGTILINVTNKYSIRKWTARPVEKLKNWKPLFQVMNWTKEKVLRKGKLHHFPFTPRVHSPGAFDRFLSENGFHKNSHNYFDFAVLPAPLDTLLGVVTTPTKKWLERYSRKNMVVNGTGYIVSATLEKN